MNQALKPVILCGGTGTRLWPLSRKLCPKQFVPIIDGKSLLTLTCERLNVVLQTVRAAGAQVDEPVMLVTNKEYRFLAKQAALAAGVRPSLLLEPTGRNTAAAMAAAALMAQTQQDIDPGAAYSNSEQQASSVLLFLPADNYIPDYQEFADAVFRGIEAARRGHWVVAGASPSFPATGYGYIQSLEHDEGGLYRVARFVEKPDRNRALSMIRQGNHYWNAGIFLVRSDVLVDSLHRLRPRLVEQVQGAVLEGGRLVSDAHEFLLGESFRSAESISIDHAVLEHQQEIRMVKIEGLWDDVGSWNSLANLTTEPDADNNRIDGQGIAIAGTTDCYVRAHHRPVVAVGLNGLVIVDTADAVLVASRDATENLKQAVVELDSRRYPEAERHRLVARPWGTYNIIDAGDRFLVKRITVNPGAALSLQMHHHRTEHWIVVKGTAKVTRGDEVYLLAENESTFIPLGITHRLENPGLLALEMIEVQSGSFLSEDDIVRFSDQYGRETNDESTA